jgi:hypothetical protein
VSASSETDPVSTMRQRVMSWTAQAALDATTNLAAELAVRARQ